MKSLKTTPTPPKLPAGKIVLEIRGCAEITSFKNSKMITRGRLITDPKKQEKMDQYIRAIELALYCAYRTNESETSTAQQFRCWILSNVPLDDSWQWIPEINIKGIEVPPGHEGADIIIERLPDYRDILAEL